MRLNPHHPGRSLTSSCSRLFAKSGYRVAIIARNAEHVKKLAQEITTAGFEAAPFKLPLEYIEVLGGIESEAYKEFKRLFREGFDAARKHCDRIVSTCLSRPV